MKKYSIENGVVCGKENNDDLFIRKVNFEPGYAEDDFHCHKNSFEFYVVLSGRLVFQTENGEKQEAEENSIIYFADLEKHKIISVSEKADLLCIKKIESEKIG